MRWRYLAGLALLSTLDEHVRKVDAPAMCPLLYYLMSEHNGGKDPTAPDPADRWSSEAELARVAREVAEHGAPLHPAFVNRTADCVAGAAWGQGWDRYQPARFSHIYDGWINTDSMRMDVRGPGRCFRRLDRPEPGATIVYESDPHHHTHGVPVGHIGGIVGYKLAEWDEHDPACWEAIDVVDISAQGAGNRANLLHSGAHWFGKDAWFIISTMTP